MPIGIRRSHIQGHGAQQHRSDWNFVICGTCRPVAVRFLHPLVPSDGGAANPAVRRSGRLVNVGPFACYRSNKAPEVAPYPRAGCASGHPKAQAKSPAPGAASASRHSKRLAKDALEADANAAILRAWERWGISRVDRSLPVSETQAILARRTVAATPGYGTPTWLIFPII